MRVVTSGPGPNDWVVKADWHGSERIVFGPDSIWKCVAFACYVESEDE